MRWLILVPAILLAGCATTSFDADAAATANSLEFRILEDGSVAEIEYHVGVERVPPAVHAGWKRLYGEVAPTAAEMEVADGESFYELAASMGGRKVEAMFRPDGALHELEIEVPVDEVPERVRAAVAAAYPNGALKAWEVIQDAGQQPVSWHAKLTDGGRELKLNVTPAGMIDKVLREMAAEIEVPVAR